MRSAGVGASNSWARRFRPTRSGPASMDAMVWFSAALLGFVEGLTEFIPVSSTGHLILIGHMLGFHSPGNAFEVLMQLGAILAILLVYAHRLIALARSLPGDPQARKFVVGVVIAFLPAAVIGV